MVDDRHYGVGEGGEDVIWWTTGIMGWGGVWGEGGRRCDLVDDRHDRRGGGGGGGGDVIWWTTGIVESRKRDLVASFRFGKGVRGTGSRCDLADGVHSRGGGEGRGVQEVLFGGLRTYLGG